MNNNLTSFVEMTNFCENKGFTFELIRSRKGITCDLYKNDNLVKVGSTVFQTSIDAQHDVFTKLYLLISK